MIPLKSERTAERQYDFADNLRAESGTLTLR